MQTKHIQYNKAFSLIEIMVSLAVFSVVVLVAAGALLSIIDGAKKTQTLKSVINNLNFAMEDISRHLRVGTGYSCGAGTLPPVPSSCSNGTNIIRFKSNKFRPGPTPSPIYSEYRFENDQFFYDADLEFDPAPVAITAPEVHITKATFHVTGAEPAPGDMKQPKIFLVVQGYAEITARSKSMFNLQTTITQRVLDF